MIITCSKANPTTWKIYQQLLCNVNVIFLVTNKALSNEDLKYDTSNCEKEQNALKRHRMYKRVCK
jgi:hypothetical protein